MANNDWKSVSELNASDLQRYPIWGFDCGREGAADSDETFVCPIEFGTLPESTDTLFIAAIAKLADCTLLFAILPCNFQEGILIAVDALLLPMVTINHRNGVLVGHSREHIARFCPELADKFPIEFDAELKITLADRSTHCWSFSGVIRY